MKADAKDVLEQALNEDELHVEVRVTGEMLVGNPRGLNLAASFVHSNTKSPRTIARSSRSMARSSRSRRVKPRRISKSTLWRTVFKRDKLRNATEADRRMITEGYGWAHGGDAVVDALSYQGRCRRRDIKAFEELYGIFPAEVQTIDHKPTIAVRKANRFEP
ncbi:hypothetical protein BDD12DRAFT_350281 [Trichophaea hybrida]|nr:hypothetical protein BDD12DRAFT_350281 [Trichophaea hybrida]